MGKKKKLKLPKGKSRDAEYERLMELIKPKKKRGRPKKFASKI